MVYITQLIYIREGQQDVFDAFEKVAIPLIEKYNGKMLFRLRPADTSFIETAIEKPYEIHLVEFDNEEGFLNFQKDETRKQFLHLKEQSIRSSVLLYGRKLA